MKPFVLEEALKGYPVVDRGGACVEILTYVDDESVERPLVARVIQPSSEVLTYTKEGRHLLGCHESKHDLFMAPQEITLWVNILRHPQGGFISRVYRTEGVALDEKDFDDYIGTYPIRVEI